MIGFDVALSLQESVLTSVLKDRCQRSTAATCSRGRRGDSSEAPCSSSQSSVVLTARWPTPGLLGDNSSSSFPTSVFCSSPDFLAPASMPSSSMSTLAARPPAVILRKNSSISSRLLPLVSGTYFSTKRNETVATHPKAKKAPASVSAVQIERNVLATIPLTRRFRKSPKAIAVARR